MNSKTQNTTIDDYLNAFPEEVQEKLRTIRDLIRKEVPERTEETISYGIPTFKLNGKYIVYFAGYKKHISIYPILHIEGKIKEEIAPYIKGRGTLQFPLNKELPLPLIKKVVNMLVKENQERTGK